MGTIVGTVGAAVTWNKTETRAALVSAGADCYGISVRLDWGQDSGDANFEVSEGVSISRARRSTFI